MSKPQAHHNHHRQEHLSNLRLHHMMHRGKDDLSELRVHYSHHRQEHLSKLRPHHIHRGKDYQWQRQYREERARRHHKEWLKRYREEKARKRQKEWVKSHGQEEEREPRVIEGYVPWQIIGTMRVTLVVKRPSRVEREINDIPHTPSWEQEARRIRARVVTIIVLVVVVGVAIGWLVLRLSH